MIVLAYILTALWAMGTASLLAFTLHEACETVHGLAVGFAVLLPCWVLVGVAAPLYIISYFS